ncbi:MAG: gluconeogenesis factor YvcK family protein [Candidatus Sungiibacteriota bacterium]
MTKTSVKNPKVVVIGGGTGVFTTLSGLRKYALDLTAVISMADDGGSTGILREEFGILPPGDIRRVLVAMSHSDDRVLSDLFNYRFDQGGLSGHTFGNIMLTALERLTGSFENAVKEACRILGVEGEVLPVTLANTRLAAELEDGTIIRGESNIDIPKHDGNLRIKRVWLDPKAKINERARRAMIEADMIVIGPGDLYTSIVPNLVVEGVSEAIKKSKAKKVYVANLMTKWGETNGFKASDFIAAVEKYLGKCVLDYALINTKRPSPERMRYYEKESAEFVEAGEFLKKPVPVFGDFLRKKGFVRHNPERLAQTLVSLL